jgi:hypothetical protein
MIKNIIDLLNASDWHIGDPDIDFAMGVNKLPSNLKQTKQLIKRRKYGYK